ncbi:MAG: MoaD family protein [Nitrososphaerota archaeon]|nr:MoaD family protein [Nitrososphaerota archaeon]MDG6955419.1 MoaD family protein [Nitrososphaerota archaeon]MDG6963845.1 MoaD family protein [Nitrososphaerota archaeon]MDG6968505.1 MoaD family protein [Nitrososphaerota archaeon]MDG6973367.1 MoaD family protein [Nitrososphaerota archaeon]
MIRVKLTAQLKDWTNGVSSLEMDTVPDLQSMVRKLDARFPGIGQRIVDDQEKIRTHVNIFVNSENSKDLQREMTKLRDGDTVHILPSVAGG